MRVIRKSRLLLILLFVGFVAYSLPQYYFNFWEVKFRELFTEIEAVNQKAADLIEQRSGREGGIKTIEEVKTISETIQNNLDMLETKIQEQETISNKQNQVVILLPKKFKSYLQQRNQAFDKYYLSLRKFKKLKEFESLTQEILQIRDEAGDSLINDFSQDPQEFKATDTMLEHLGSIRSKIETFYKEGYLTESYYQALLNEVDTDIGYLNIFKESIKNKYTSNELDSLIAKNGSKYDDVALGKYFYENSDTIVYPKQAEWQKFYSEFNEKCILAAKYYNDNKLYNDPVSFVISNFNKNYPKNLFRNLLTDIQYEDKFIDLDGDSKLELIRLILPSNNSEYASPTMIAYGENMNEIARLPENMPINVPISKSAKVFTLDKKTNKQTISFEFTTGPHETLSMFFELFTAEDGVKTLLPICLKLDARQALDCVFWSSEPGYLKADDFNDDGILDVAEIVSEYPKDGVLDSELTNAIQKATKEDAKLSGYLTRIAKREKGGKGELVVWDIYSYNGEFFQKYSKPEYESILPSFKEHFKYVEPIYLNIKSRFELSKDSENYNNFVRSIWTKKYQGEEYYPNSPLS